MALREEFTRAIQDYTKAIYSLQQPGKRVTTSALAEKLGVSAPSVSEMIRTLVDRKLVSYEPYHGVTLTPDGTRMALEVIRHHRLLELFLVEILEVPREKVHEEAEVLEHALSEELEARIAAVLGDPVLDPHGHPIPTLEGAVEELEGSMRLSDLEPGESGVLVQVSDSDPELLRRVGEQKLAIGDRVELVSKRPGGGMLVVHDRGRTRMLDASVADTIRVSILSGKAES
jgi:DtxR family Mn-dependent transcriptional regulator